MLNILSIQSRPPNVGETAVVTKILSYQNPPFGQVIVIYCDGGSTQKYDDLEHVEVISEIPALRIGKVLLKHWLY